MHWSEGEEIVQRRDAGIVTVFTRAACEASAPCRPFRPPEMFSKRSHLVPIWSRSAPESGGQSGPGPLLSASRRQREGTKGLDHRRRSGEVGEGGRCRGGGGRYFAIARRWGKVYQVLDIVSRKCP